MLFQTTSYPLLLLSHGCEIDKNGADVLLVARIREVTELSAGNQGYLRLGRVRNAMLLTDLPAFNESFADFGYTFRVLRSELDRADGDGRRVASMSVDGRIALQVFLYRFYARRFPGDPFPDDPDDI